MLNNHVTSKAEIAKELNLSMPTVLANVNDLLEKMVLEETGNKTALYGNVENHSVSEKALFCIIWFDDVRNVRISRKRCSEKSLSGR